MALAMKKEKYSVVVVEDDDGLRRRLIGLLEDSRVFDVLASAATFQQGVEALQRLNPDILLTDIGLPDGSGIDIIRAIQQHSLDTQAIVISGFQDEHQVFSALEAGANGYIHKQDGQQDIVDAILMMVQGGSPISPVIARLMLKKFQPVVTQTLPESLTERQTLILKLISQGFSSREIAEKLDISYYTVTTHIKNIYNKLQVNSRSEAIHEAYKLGLIK